MGGKYLVWWNGIDDIYNTIDDVKRTLYLTSGAVKTYESLGEQEVKLTQIQSIDDNIIEVFQLQYATTAKIGSTYQQNLEYFLLLGYTREQAVAKAQASIGITKEQMIAQLDSFQKEIIASKALSIATAEQAIKTQVTTQDFSELNLTDIVNMIDVTRNDAQVTTIGYIPSDIISPIAISQPSLSPVTFGTVEQQFIESKYEDALVSAKVSYRLTKQIPTTLSQIKFIIRDSRGSIIHKTERDITLKSSDTISYNISIGLNIDRNISIEHYFLYQNNVIGNTIKQSLSWQKGAGSVPLPIETSNFISKYSLPIVLFASVAGIGGLIYAIEKRKKKI